MVPYSTVLALLSVLMLLAGCSQKSPPRPGQIAASSEAARSSRPQNSETGAGSSHPDSNVSKGGGFDAQALIYPAQGSQIFVNQASIPDPWTLVLLGEDAAKLYQLSKIQAVPGTQKEDLIKQGRQFSCTHAAKGYYCLFKMILPSGSVPVISDEPVLTTVPEIAQRAEITDFLTIKDTGPKVRLFVPDQSAKLLFKALTEMDAVLAPDKIFKPGLKRQGADFNCVQSIHQTGDQTPVHACYLHLDLDQALVDKPSPREL